MRSDMKRFAVLGTALLGLAATGVPLVLLDIPKDRPASRVRLQYLPEADRQSIRQEWIEPVGLEDSTIWRDLHERFLEAAGKVRLFCHPRVADTLEAAMKRPVIESIVATSLQQVDF